MYDCIQIVWTKDYKYKLQDCKLNITFVSLGSNVNFTILNSISMENLTYRIKKLLEIQQLNPSQFADQIGINRSRLSHILTGRNNPSLEIVQDIMKHFPELNPDWLLSGDGGMYRNNERRESPKSSDKGGSNDLFSYQSREENQILKSQALENSDLASQVIDNEFENTENIPKSKEDKKSNVFVENQQQGRPKIKLITILYDNNEYEILYPEDNKG
jgi:transcriptional regulator with XRE-family HTH domain